MIMDAEGKRPINRNIDLGEKISYQELDADWGWVVSAGAYEMDFNNGANTILFGIMAVLVASILIGLVVILLFASHIAKPISAISKALLEMSQNNLHVDEINSLSHH